LAGGCCGAGDGTYDGFRFKVAESFKDGEVILELSGILYRSAFIFNSQARS